MAEMQDLMTQWRNLKTQAESGQLRMDPAIGDALKAHAETMKNRLGQMITDAGALDHLGGFGSLGTATALQGKFERKANGGNGSAVERLKQSVEVLELMAETYEKATRTIAETDQANSQKLANVDTGAK